MSLLAAAGWIFTKQISSVLSHVSLKWRPVCGGKLFSNDRFSETNKARILLLKINVIFRSIHLTVENGGSGASYSRPGRLVTPGHLGLDRLQSSLKASLGEQRRFV